MGEGEERVGEDEGGRGLRELTGLSGMKRMG